MLNSFFSNPNCDEFVHNLKSKDKNLVPKKISNSDNLKKKNKKVLTSNTNKKNKKKKNK